MYYFRFADLLTDNVVLETSAPFTADRRIMQPGAFSCSFSITSNAVGGQLAKIVPQKTICHVYRAGQVVGSYIIWAKTISCDRNGLCKMDVQGATLESYLYRRRLLADETFTAAEQFEIADWLVAQAQVGPVEYPASAAIGLGTRTWSASGVTRDRAYSATESDSVGDLLEDLANVDDGFEYVIHTYEDSGIMAREIQYGYPVLSPWLSPIVLEHPGNVTSFSVLYDGTAGGTVFQTRGQSIAAEAGEESLPLCSDVVPSDVFLAAGYPALDIRHDYQNVTVKSTLDAYAVWWAANRSGPLVTPSFTVDAGRMFDSGFTQFALGSPVSVVMDNPAFPAVSGASTFGGVPRLIGFELSVTDAGSEEMKILFETGFDPTDIGS